MQYISFPIWFAVYSIYLFQYGFMPSKLMITLFNCNKNNKAFKK